MSELDKLEQYLKDHNYHYDRIDRDSELIPLDEYESMIKNGMENLIPAYGERHQIIVYKKGIEWFDAICHWGSYGYEQGLLEIMGDISKTKDKVEGWLTADEVIRRMEGV